MRDNSRLVLVGQDGSAPDVEGRARLRHLIDRLQVAMLLADARVTAGRDLPVFGSEPGSAREEEA